MFPFVDILFKLNFSISHRSVDKCMVPASALSDTRSLLRSHIPNPRSHLGNKTPTPFPLFFRKETSVQTVFWSWKISAETIYWLSPPICMLYPGFSCAASHVIIFHMHKCSVWICFTIIVSPLESGCVPVINGLAFPKRAGQLRIPLV